jgi:hypothetical protein
MDGLIYLLHFSRPISPSHTCQHYIGWCLDLPTRMHAHRAGAGARLTQVAVERGIGFEVVRTWPGTREFERQLKERKCGPRLCPVCCRQRGRTVAAPHQLALPLDEPAPWELPGYVVPRVSTDWYEAQWLRHCGPAPRTVALPENWDEGLL